MTGGTAQGAAATPSADQRPGDPPETGPADAGSILARYGGLWTTAWLWALAALAVEGLVVLLLQFRAVVSTLELARALGALFPLIAFCAALIAVISLPVLATLAKNGHGRGRLIATLTGLGGAGLTAWGVSGGRHFEGWRRPAFTLLVASLATVVCWWMLPRVAAIRARMAVSARRRMTGLVIATAAGLDVTNLLVLPRLYPAFHLSLAMLTCLTVTLLIPGAAKTSRVRRWLAFAFFVVAVVSLPGAPQRLARYDNIRWIVTESAPMLGWVVRLGAKLTPHKDHPLAATGPETQSPSPGKVTDFRGHSVLLITVDALRADHVGAYGYARPTTKAIDELAAQGVVFEAAYTPTPHTSYALTSLMTGKYMRPLLLQGLGANSDTWAASLRRYDYQTAAFYPPAAFFIDKPRFESFRLSGFDFEYRKNQFSSAAARVREVDAYLNQHHGSQPLFTWVHLFEPHEPYVVQAAHDFGLRDIDRYDGEIAAADDAIGKLVARMRNARPKTIVIVTADHGEEFGDHGGRYHGTTVYDEQVRVPLVISAPGLLSPARVKAPVSLIDLLPTILTGLDIPLSPRLRGRDLGPLMVGQTEGRAPFAFAETDEQTLLAEGDDRLICLRRIGACQLYDLISDPQQQVSIANKQSAKVDAMRARLRTFTASHGRFETHGSSRWPPALRRGIAGDGEAAADVAPLLDDASVNIRRKAAEVLFDLARPDTAIYLRRALSRDEDVVVKRFAALALTRLGQGAPLTFDLLDSEERRWRRLAALALAEVDDDRGDEIIADWLGTTCPGEDSPRSVAVGFTRARAIVAAAGRLKSRRAVPTLVQCLADVRLRPFAARALAMIGDNRARGPLLKAWMNERYFDARVTLANALIALGAGREMRPGLLRFLGTPDPLPDGLLLASKLDILPLLGGPRPRDAVRLRRFARDGIAISVTVPDGDSSLGLRALVLARSDSEGGGTLRVGLSSSPVASGKLEPVPEATPELDPARTVTLAIEGDGKLHQVAATLPDLISDTVKPGDTATFIVYATQDITLEIFVVLPLADELPPPPPKPWAAASSAPAMAAP